MTAIIFRYEPVDLANHPNKRLPHELDVAKIDGVTHVFWRGEWRTDMGAAYVTDEKISVRDPFPQAAGETVFDG